MFGPVSSSTRRSGDRSQWLGTKAAWPASAASTTGWRPPRIRNSSSSVTTGPAPRAGFGQFRRRLRRVQQGERVGAGGERVGLCQRAACTSWAKTSALARGGAVAGLGDAAVEVGQFRRGEAGAVGHALAQGQFREGAQLLDGGGGHFDDVAKLRVVADLQAGDAVALRVVELHRRQHAAAVVAQAALGIQFAVETGRMTPPSSSRCGAGSASASVSVRPGRGDRSPSDGARRLPARAAAGPPARPPPDAARGQQSVAQRGEVARAAAVQRQPAQRAGDVGRRAQRRAQPFAAAVRVGEHPGPGVLPRRWRRDRSAARPASRQQARARRRSGCACTAASSVCCAAAIAGALDLQAGARRRDPSPARRRGPAARGGRGGAGARLGGAHVIQGERGRDRLGIGEAAERVQAGGAERLRQPAAGDQRRRRPDGPARALVGPIAQRQGWRGRGFRPVPGGRAARGFSGGGTGGGFEQAGGDVEPGGADLCPGRAPARAAGWAGRRRARLPR